MKRIRNEEWKLDGNLKSELQRLINEGFQRQEILPFMQRDYSQYAWSSRTLDRRIEFFKLCKCDNESSVNDAYKAISNELQGPGALLGYRAMHKKINQVHKVKIPRDVVYAIMGDIDPKGLEQRRPGVKKKKEKKSFESPGPNFVHSLDGHDKLMGFQNWTFPLAVYGCIDTCRRKLLWIKIWTSNSDPKYPGLWYVQYLKRSKIIARKLRIDKGTETIEMTGIHAFLVQKLLGTDGDDTGAESIIYGPSTSNQIERWWRELHEKLERYFKVILMKLKTRGHYNPNTQLDRDLIAFIMVPILEHEVAIFIKLWNTHRIRKQRGVSLPDGIPDHIYNFPEKYGLEECGLRISDKDVAAAEDVATIASDKEDYISDNFRKICKKYAPNEIKNDQIYDTFIYLKKKVAQHT